MTIPSAPMLRLPYIPVPPTNKVNISTGDDDMWDHRMAINMAIIAANQDMSECCVPDNYNGIKLPDALAPGS